MSVILPGLDLLRLPLGAQHKPTWKAAINWDHPTARGLEVFHPNQWTLEDIAKNRGVTEVSGTSAVPLFEQPESLVGTRHYDSTTFKYKAYSGIETTDFTLLWIGTAENFNTGPQLLCDDQINGTTRRLQFRINDTGNILTINFKTNSTYHAVTSVGAVTPNELTTVILSREGRTVRFWVNGVYSEETLNLDPAPLSGMLMPGSDDGGENLLGYIYGWGGWSRPMQQAEMEALGQDPWGILEPAYEKPYYSLVAGGGGGTTSVQTDRSLSWEIYNTVQTQAALQYQVQNSVAADQALSWQVFNSTQAQRALQFAVQNSVAADRTLSWQVQNSVAASQPLSWGVFNAVQTSRDLQWTVESALNSVATSRAVQFSVYNAAAASRDLQWQVFNSVATDRQVQFQVLNSAAAERTLGWSVLNSAATDRTLAWQVMNTVATSQPLQWQVQNSVATSREFLFQVYNAVAQDLAIQFSVHNTQSVQNSANIQWTVLNSVENQVTIRYQVQGTDVVADLDPRDVTFSTVTGKVIFNSPAPKASFH